MVTGCRWAAAEGERGGVLCPRPGMGFGVVADQVGSDDLGVAAELGRFGCHSLEKMSMID